MIVSSGDDVQILQDSGVDSGVVTDDGETRVNQVKNLQNNQSFLTAKMLLLIMTTPWQGEKDETGSNYCYIDGSLELHPPPENLDLLLHSIQRVERLNQRLEQTEEEIVALRFAKKLT